MQENKMRPLHIAMITRGIPSPEYPTVGIFEFDYAKAFLRRGHKVSILAIDMRSIRRRRKFGSKSYEKEGISIISVDWPVGNVPRRMLYWISYFALEKAYQELVEKSGIPDLLHATFTDFAFIASLLKKKVGLPLYVCEPNSHINIDPIPDSLFRAADLSYHSADVVQAVSPRFQKRLGDLFGIDAVNIPILPNLSLFRYKEGPRKKSIVSTGRVTKAKGMRELLEAFFRISEVFPEYTLDIFGDGDDRAMLEERVRRNKADMRVKFHGAVPREVIAKAYDTAELFSLCSHHETFGLSYIEAWGSGLPVLSTRCGGPEHAFTENNGLLVPVGDVDAIEEGLRGMIENIGQYDRGQIARIAHEEFSEERIIDAIMGHFREITK